MFFLLTEVNPPPIFPCFLSHCVQIINFREPVTLDFLDAELEDNNKEEVKITSLKQHHDCKLMYISYMFHLSLVFYTGFVSMFLYGFSWLCLLLRSDDRWLMGNQGKGKSRRSLSQLMRQVINIWDSIMIQSSTFLNVVVMNLNHSVCSVGSVVSLQLWGKMCWGCDSVTYQTLFVVVNRGTSTRPYGRTHGRLWRAQIIGRFEIKNPSKLSSGLRTKDCASWSCEWSPTLNILICPF